MIEDAALKDGFDLIDQMIRQLRNAPEYETDKSHPLIFGSTELFPILGAGVMNMFTSTRNTMALLTLTAEAGRKPCQNGDPNGRSCLDRKFLADNDQKPTRGETVVEKIFYAFEDQVREFCELTGKPEDIPTMARDDRDARLVGNFCLSCFARFIHSLLFGCPEIMEGLASPLQPSQQMIDATTSRQPRRRLPKLVPREPEEE